MSEPSKYTITIEELDPEYDEWEYEYDGGRVPSEKFMPAKCDLCNAEIGWVEKTQYSYIYDTEIDGIAWVTTYECSNGTLLCEDCAYPLILTRKV